MKDTAVYKFEKWPVFQPEEIEAACRVMQSGNVNYWTGNECNQFEIEFAKLVGVRHSIALSNGTVALELALIGLGIKEGDEVVVPSRSYFATVSCVIAVGAVPVFVDVDKEHGVMSASEIKKVITPNTRAVICVHLAGYPCDMDSIMRLSAEFEIKVIEDCAQAHGALYQGKSVGSFGHVSAWSFCQDKIISTCGEGGMVTTNDSELWKRMWSYKDHGKSYEAVKFGQAGTGFKWLHESFGTNWRMTEIQAAVGCIQIKKLPLWRKKRASNAEKIRTVCRVFNAMQVANIPCHITHAYYRCCVKVSPEGLKRNWSRDKIRDAIQAHGVPCFDGSCSEIYLEKAFEGRVFTPLKRFKNAKSFTEQSIAFLVHPTLSTESVDRTCDAISKVMSVAVR